MNYHDIPFFLGLRWAVSFMWSSDVFFSLGSGKKQDGAVAGRNANQAGCDEKGGAEHCRKKETQKPRPENIRC